MEEIDLNRIFPEYEISSSYLTKTVREVLEIDGIPEEMKNELRQHPENYCVWIIDEQNKIAVSPLVS